MSNTPDPSNGYFIKPEQYADRAFLQAVFTSVHERLQGVEAKEADYQAAIDFLTTQALASVSATLTAEIEGQRALLADIQADAEVVLAAYEQINGAGGVPATQIKITAIGTFNPGEVQAAIAALYSDKAPKASPTFTGTATAPAITIGSAAGAKADVLHLDSAGDTHLSLDRAGVQKGYLQALPSAVRLASASHSLHLNDGGTLAWTGQFLTLAGKTVGGETIGAGGPPANGTGVQGDKYFRV